MVMYRLASSPGVYTPGLIAWAINGYALKADREGMVKLITNTFKAVPTAAVAQLLSKAVPHQIEDETVIFSVDEPDLSGLKPFTIHCSTCGSENVRADATAEWNAELQIWELVTIFDHRDCEDCGGECSVFEKEIAQ